MGLNFADGQNGVKLFEQLAAVLGIDNKRQRIRQIKAVNTEQRFRVDRIAAGPNCAARESSSGVLVSRFSM